MQMAPQNRIPLPLKIAYSAFMAVLVPAYAYNYGFANFLYFCDLALFITLVGMWREDALLISMPAVGILAPQLLWLADFGVHFGGLAITGMSDYMFDASLPLFLRSLSLFHGWLPLLLLYLVARTGYDRRAFPAWTVLSWIVLLVCYTLMPPPRPDAGNAAVNINYVYGFSQTEPQAWMPPLAWLATLMLALPVLLFLPTHLALVRWLTRPTCGALPGGASSPPGCRADGDCRAAT